MASNETSKYKLSVTEGTELQLSLNGAQGPTGPANTLSIGTVTTGETGVAAAATITGAAPTQTLNLTLPKGNTGTAATVTVGTTTTGAAGSSASVTNVGTSSAAVFNFSVPKGDTGNTGATGATGSAGSSNTLSIGTVTEGGIGVASATITGASPNQTLNLVVPTGATGATGATGTAATIAVGTVTTGEASSSVTINNSGTSGAAVFDFSIPRGPQPSITITNTALTSVTLSDSDNNTVVRCTASTAITLTVPSTLAAGFSCMVIQAGTGQVTITAGAGTTLNSFGTLLKTAGQHAPASIIRVASGMYNVSGNLI